MQCKLTSCKRFVCLWCMNLSFRSKQACHTHVRACKMSLNRGSIIGSNDGIDQTTEINKAQANNRKEKIERYISTNKLSTKQKESLLLLMGDELKALGIRII